MGNRNKLDWFVSVEQKIQTHKQVQFSFRVHTHFQAKWVKLRVKEKKIKEVYFGSSPNVVNHVDRERFGSVPLRVKTHLHFSPSRFSDLAGLPISSTCLNRSKT